MCGHVGVTKTLELVSRDFWWHGLRSDLGHYVRLCDECQRNKASTLKSAGKLQPLPVPGRRWE
eukprot:1139199-Pelagomonas_calceolata.AAC.1